MSTPMPGWNYAPWKAGGSGKKKTFGPPNSVILLGIKNQRNGLLMKSFFGPSGVKNKIVPHPK